MPYYYVVWSLQKGKIVKAESENDALIQVQNMDLVHEGVYLDNSYKHEQTTKLDDELVDVIKNEEIP